MGMRDEIKAFVAEEKPALLPVPTPELPKWNGQIYVGRACPRAVASCWKDSDDDEQIDERARFAALVACDEAGSRIFQDEDVLWLSTCAMLTPMVERLYWAGRHHNGLTDENRTAWRKNSASTGGGGSPSSCAAPSTPDTASTSNGS
jgi:hypothetical protein